MPDIVTDERLSIVMPVLLEHRWQIPMTICAIHTLYATALVPFEMVIVEAVKSDVSLNPSLAEFLDCLGSRSAASGMQPGGGVWGWQSFDAGGPSVQHIVLPYSGNPTHDINIGLDACRNNIRLYMGNDVFVRPGWDVALLECFEQPRCGIATLASSDLNHTPVKDYYGKDIITEGLYGPFMAFEGRWRFDAATFPSQFADADLIMRVYEQGLRSYRHNRVVIEHLNRQTINGPAHDLGFAEAKARFEDKWRQARLETLIWKILWEGWIL